nr:protein ALP1-like isoform X1 [Aedes albopictus]
MLDLFMVILLYRLYKQYQSSGGDRRWWVHPLLEDRPEKGFFAANYEKMRQHPERFFKQTRMDPETFDVLLEKISSRLQKYSLRPSLSPTFRLFLTLSYLSHGTAFPFLAASYKIGESTARKIIQEVCGLLWQTLKSDYLPELTVQDWADKAAEFYSLWDLPNCCGAVDGKHVYLQCPPNSGSQFFNYKGTFSINLMAVSDACSNFIAVDVGAYGGNSDGGVFAESTFGKRLYSGQLGLPQAACLPGATLEIPHYLVGDAAFPLKPYLMRPFPGRLLPAIRENFNKRLSRARRIVENAFGILVARWRILRNTLTMEPAQAERIVLACVVLHNFLKKECSSRYCPPGYADVIGPEGEIIIQGEWRKDSSPLPSCSNKIGNNSAAKAFEVRDYLSEYLFTHPVKAKPEGITINH